MEGNELSVGIGSGLKPHTINVKPAGIIDVKSTETTNIRRVEGARSTHFIIKTYKNKEGRDQNLANYLLLKKAGFPVPTTVRPVNDTELLVTDLTRNEKREIYSTRISENTAPHSLLKNRRELKNNLRQIVKLARQKGIFLTADSFFLVLDENQKGEIIIGDFGGIYTDQTRFQEHGHASTKEAVSQWWESLNGYFVGDAYFPINDPLY